MDVTACFIDANDTGGPQYSSEDMRALFSLLFAPGPRPLTAEPGVVRGMDVTLDGAAVSVAAGGVIATSALGSFVILNHSKTRLALTPAHATYSRIDLIVARAIVTGDDIGGVVEIVTGSPAADPQEPQAPAHSLTLATVTVPARGEPALTVKAAPTPLAGSPTPVSAVLGPGARSGLVTYEATASGGVVHVDVVASGSSPILASLPNHTGASGAGVVSDDAGELWPVRVWGGAVYAPSVPKARTVLAGAVSVTNRNK
ncbi:hypothetical protein H8R18_01345 [Nanchangia anserum]|uniref:Uncharacterized protein n=1 Tax=Nanchangia anserum TaxID=2692125 RepID=A0A8I0G8J1_9ACTO|nr:hypothetical protein [Nanchangia anserum]MBD3689880.1 hypothetical protein [Nanchangia anserum]QOX82050.1 hypothetical protein H8R18_01345 [Nanchangia anserum]